MSAAIWEFVSSAGVVSYSLGGNVSFVATCTVVCLLMVRHVLLRGNFEC